MVCSIGSSKDAKRTGVVHIAFNTIGTVLFLIVMTIMQKLAVFGAAYWIREVDSGVIANFQTIFNLLTAFALIPFTNLLVKLSMAVVKDEKQQVVQKHPELHALDEKLYNSPAMAISVAVKSISAMGALARDNFAKGLSVLAKYDPVKIAQINEDENEIDQFTDVTDRFLIGLSKHVETEWDDRQVDMLMQCVPNFERIGDYAVNMVEFAETLQSESTSFSESAKRELEIIGSAVNDIITLTVEAFASGDNEIAKKIEPLEETIDDMVNILKDRHTKRLKNGLCSISSGLVFMEMLTNLERASDQCSSIGLTMLARTNSHILENHHEYLREMHLSNDVSYRSEKEYRREQYIKPLKEIQ